MSGTKYIQLTHFANGSAQLVINREDALNALNTDLLNELSKVLQFELEPNDSLKGLIITGSGKKSFVAGADLKEMRSMKSLDALRFSRMGQNVFQKIYQLRCPTIAAVNGYALGGGLELALSCDFIMASKNAILGLPETSLGLVPGFGGTQFLIRRVGIEKAKELIFSADRLNAEEAHRINLVNRVFEQDELIEGSVKFLKRMMNNSKTAVCYSKNIVQSGLDVPIERGLRLEQLAFSAIFDSEDKAEGINAFLDKRKPNYSGR